MIDVHLNDVGIKCSDSYTYTIASRLICRVGQVDIIPTKRTEMSTCLSANLANGAKRDTSRIDKFNRLVKCDGDV